MSAAPETILLTLRLTRSLSAARGRELRAAQAAARQQWRELAETGAAPDVLAAARQRAEKQFFIQFDLALSQSTVGPAWLAEYEKMAETLAGEILLLEESGFIVPAFAILPRHAHVLVRRPAQNRLSLPKALELLQLRAAQHCRRLVRPRLPPEAHFWHPGAHEYVVPDEADLPRLLAYIRESRRRGGLPARFEEWPYVKEE